MYSKGNGVIHAVMTHWPWRAVAIKRALLFLLLTRCITDFTLHLDQGSLVEHVDRGRVCVQKGKLPQDLRPSAEKMPLAWSAICISPFSRAVFTKLFRSQRKRKRSKSKLIPHHLNSSKVT